MEKQGLVSFRLQGVLHSANTREFSVWCLLDDGMLCREVQGLGGALICSATDRIPSSLWLSISSFVKRQNKAFHWSENNALNTEPGTRQTLRISSSMAGFGKFFYLPQKFRTFNFSQEKPITIHNITQMICPISLVFCFTGSTSLQKITSNFSSLRTWN